MSRKRRFLIGCLFISLAYVFPLASVVLMEFVLGAVIVLAGLVLSVYTLYRLTLGKVKPKYPGVPPTGQPDIYTKLRVPRPIYEDMEQYPWLFGKKGQETARWTKRKLKKKR